MLTLSHAFQMFLAQPTFAARTRESYAEDLAPLMRALGEAPISALTSHVATDFLAAHEHPDELPIQRGLKLLPLLLIAQGSQHQGQAVIAKASLTDLLPSADGQGLHPLRGPALHLIHAMIPFRHDVRQPDGGRPAQAHALPVAMRLEVLIQQLWYTHLVTVGQQERKIVHSFGRDVHYFCHAHSFPHLQNLVTFWPNHEL